MDHSIAHASPVNAVVVLSRADEIGAARADAMDSARTIAARYASDGRVKSSHPASSRSRGSAETGATLRQDQFEWVRQLAGVPVVVRDRLLVSVERFRDDEANPLSEAIREELLVRLGLYGLRLATRLVADGSVKSAPELSTALLEHSGIRALQRVLEDSYAARASVLKARSALVALRAIAIALDREGVAGGSRVIEAIERLEASSGELALMRLQHLVLAGHLVLSDDERAEVDRLARSEDARTRAGVDPSASDDDLRSTALAGIDRWRARAGNPFSDRRTIEAAEIISRAYEEIYTAAG